MRDELKSPCWQSQLLEEIVRSVETDAYWQQKLACLNSPCSQSFAVHLAIFVEPFLRFILEGEKTVESRFSKKICPPYHYVNQGDVVILKRAGGPVLGICQVASVWYYELDPASWEDIQSNFAAALCAQDPAFWQERFGASYATLLRIEHVLPLVPILCNKRDRRGWVILKPMHEQLELEGIKP